MLYTGIKCFTLGQVFYTRTSVLHKYKEAFVACIMYLTHGEDYADYVISLNDDGDEGRITARLTEVGSMQVEGRDREVERHRGGRLCQLLLGGTS